MAILFILAVLAILSILAVLAVLARATGNERRGRQQQPRRSHRRGEHRQSSRHRMKVLGRNPGGVEEGRDEERGALILLRQRRHRELAEHHQRASLDQLRKGCLRREGEPASAREAQLRRRPERRRALQAALEPRQHLPHQPRHTRLGHRVARAHVQHRAGHARTEGRHLRRREWRGAEGHQTKVRRRFSRRRRPRRLCRARNRRRICHLSVGRRVGRRRVRSAVSGDHRLAQRDRILFREEKETHSERPSETPSETPSAVLTRPFETPSAAIPPAPR